MRTNLGSRLSVFSAVESKTLKFQQSAGHPKLFPFIEVSNTSGTGKHQGRSWAHIDLMLWTPSSLPRHLGDIPTPSPPPPQPKVRTSVSQSADMGRGAQGCRAHRLPRQVWPAKDGNMKRRNAAKRSTADVGLSSNTGSALAYIAGKARPISPCAGLAVSSP